MAAVNFPNSPSSGDVHTVGTISWRYNGYAWARIPDPGAKGEPGSKGQKGEVGLTGSTGQKGEKGEKGNVEAQGNKGQKGEVGAQGPAGSAGSGGDKGQKGEVGDKGQKGQKGEGATGTKGEKGAGSSVSIGLVPPTSPTPVQGDMWWDSDDSDLHVYYNDGTSAQWVSVTSAAALKGEKGQKGEIGPKGQKGEIGPKGQKGEQGIKGDVGPKGQKGEVGVSGGQGIKGDKGEVGQKGEQNDKGEKGDTGADNSTKGQKGEVGTGGTDGDKGQKGEVGAQGNDYAFPSGTVMLFCQQSAPTGWTQVTTHHNKALRVVNNSTGGNSGGNTNFDSVFGGSKTTSNHSLTESQIPSHYHFAFRSGNHGQLRNASNMSANNYPGSGSGAGNWYESYNISASGSVSNVGRTSSVGSNSGHNHGFTNPNFNLAVLYTDVIIAQKN